MVCGMAMLSIFLWSSMAVYLQVVGFGPLLVALGGGPLRLLVRRLAFGGPVLETGCALNSFLAIKRTGFAFCTGVVKVLTDRLLSIVRVEAVDVLPRVTRLAVDCVSIIVSEVANTLNRVWLFLRRLDLSGNVALGRRAWLCRRRSLTRSRGLRGQRRRLVGHNLW
jgi:hypothetical protein